MRKKDFILEIYKDTRTVFTLRDIAMVMEESNYGQLKQKINYYVRKGSLASIRRGIYVKENFDPEELACKLYIPSYISLEYVLQKAGVIFQYHESLTPVSYLSRVVEAGNCTLIYRKIKEDILLDLSGIMRKDNGVNIATPERAMLDMLYLNREYYFDNLSGIDREKVLKILPVYQSKELVKRTMKMFSFISPKST